MAKKKRNIAVGKIRKAHTEDKITISMKGLPITRKVQYVKMKLGGTDLTLTENMAKQLRKLAGEINKSRNTETIKSKRYNLFQHGVKVSVQGQKLVYMDNLTNKMLPTSIKSNITGKTKTDRRLNEIAETFKNNLNKLTKNQLIELYDEFEDEFSDFSDYYAINRGVNYSIQEKKSLIEKMEKLNKHIETEYKDRIARKNMIQSKL